MAADGGNRKVATARRTVMTGRVRWWAGVVAVGLGSLAGCAAGEDNDAGESTSDEASGGAALEEEGAGASPATTTPGGGEGGDTPLAINTVAVSRREVVRTGEIELVVDDVEEAADETRRAAEAVEGFVADENVRSRSAQVDMTVRVPAADFEDVRSSVGELGDVVEQTVEAQDVTAEVVDVETRIGSLRASVERLQGLLSGAGDVAQLAAVEGELARRESELEALLGQQRVLRDQVDLATLRVRLSEDEPPTPADDAAGFGDGLRQGWVAAIDGGRFVLAAVGFVLPFAVPIVPAALVARWWLRRRTPGPNPATTAPASPD
jgi:hypothetical protein